MKNEYFVEITDTFSGDANFSWVTRHKVRANTERGAVWKVSRESGISWRKKYDGRYDSASGATCFFIEEFDSELHGNYRLTEL